MDEENVSHPNHTNLQQENEIIKGNFIWPKSFSNLILFFSLWADGVATETESNTDEKIVAEDATLANTCAEVVGEAESKPESADIKEDDAKTEKEEKLKLPVNKETDEDIEGNIACLLHIMIRNLEVVSAVWLLLWSKNQWRIAISDTLIQTMTEILVICE